MSLTLLRLEAVSRHRAFDSAEAAMSLTLRLKAVSRHWAFDSAEAAVSLTLLRWEAVSRHRPFDLPDAAFVCLMLLYSNDEPPVHLLFSWSNATVLGSAIVLLQDLPVIFCPELNGAAMLRLIC